jgi:hypothetical protein
MRIVGLLLCAVALCSAKVFAGDDGAFLPGDKVELILGTEDVSGIQVVKCGTMVLLKGKMKTANAKFLVWRLRQQFDNIVDLTTMTNDAYDDLIKIESGFSEELALSFNKEAQSDIAKGLTFRLVEGRLVVSGEVNNTPDIKRVEDIAKIYDKNPVINLKVKEAMIEVDAIFCRINRDNNHKFGVDGLQSATITLPDPKITSAYKTSGSFGEALASGRSSYTAQPWSLGVKAGGTNSQLSAYFGVEENDFKLLVRPHLSTVNEKEAVFHSGGQQAFELNNSDAQSVVWKDYGTKLTVTPTLTTSGAIDISVTLEFTIPQTVAATNRFYTKFSHTGRAVLEKNQALVLSGLVQQLYKMDISRTPGISRVPILNYFFGSKKKDHNQEEMVVIVVPRQSEYASKEIDNKFRSSTHFTDIVSELEERMGPVQDLEKNARPMINEGIKK